MTGAVSSLFAFGVPVIGLGLLLRLVMGLVYDSAGGNS